MAVEQRRRNLVQSGHLGPEQGRADAAARIELSQQGTVGGELAQIADGCPSDIGRRLSVALEVDDQHLVRRDHQPVDLAERRPATDHAADRLLRPAAGAEHRGELRPVEQRQDAQGELGAQVRQQVGGDDRRAAGPPPPAAAPVGSPAAAPAGDGPAGRAGSAAGPRRRSAGAPTPGASACDGVSARGGSGSIGAVRASQSGRGCDPLGRRRPTGGGRVCPPRTQAQPLAGQPARRLELERLRAG